jgi:hypothetical protein
MWENSRGDQYAFRMEWRNGKRVRIDMAREILGLSRSPGYGGDKADHINHNTLDNRKMENLRVANSFQSQANRRIYCNSHQRFKCTKKDWNQYTSSVRSKGLGVWFSVPVEVEAALMYNYAAYLIWGEYAELNVIPEDEMPTWERQWELYDMVIAKLRAKNVPFDESRIAQR